MYSALNRSVGLVESVSRAKDGLYNVFSYTEPPAVTILSRPKPHVRTITTRVKQDHATPRRVVVSMGATRVRACARRQSDGLYILDVVLYCRFKCVSLRGSDVHQYGVGGRDNFRMAQHRTTVFECLPSQVGVRLINRLLEEIKRVNNHKEFKSRLKHFLVSRAFYSVDEFAPLAGMLRGHNLIATTAHAHSELPAHLFIASSLTLQPVSQPSFIRVRRLSQDNWIKQRRAWLLLGWVTAERPCPCKQPACPAIGGGSEITFKPLAPRLSVREGFLALTSPGKIRHLYFTLRSHVVLQDTIRLPGSDGVASKPTKYHYYPHNQHIYLLPECAVQQVCNAVYVRLNFTQPLCACPSRYREPCYAAKSLYYCILCNYRCVTPSTSASTSPSRCAHVPQDTASLAMQQKVCNAVYVRLNFTQPLCACPSRYREPCYAAKSLCVTPSTSASTSPSRCVHVPQDTASLAMQQKVCNAVYVRLNFTQPLCACPSRYREPCCCLFCVWCVVVFGVCVVGCLLASTPTISTPPS
ncbi:hypothetical protein J6590_003794 [Homalodisca vitripennis]|nr:hypothetical protein J6590_003794 [Homalodisca vitripennis]